MKLIFENWRNFITEEDDPNATIRFDPSAAEPEEVAPELSKWLIENKDTQLIRYLGQGAFGKVYEVQLPNGQKSALKVINRRLAGWEQANREANNYRWVRDKKESLPEDVARYLPDIYELIETARFDEEEWTLIFMEMMNPAPTNVTHQILATGNVKSDYAMDEKEARILKDPEAVYDLVKQAMLRTSIRAMIERVPGVTNDVIDQMVVQALGPYLRGEEIDYPFDLDIPSTSYYSAASEQRQELLSSIAHVFNETLKNLSSEQGEEYDAWYLERALKDFAIELDELLEKGVVPVRHREEPYTMLGGSGKNVQDVFPEIKGLMAAMEYLYQAGFEPNDIHYGNVMVRPGSGDLVITDVGHFRGDSSREHLGSQETISI